MKIFVCDVCKANVLSTHNLRAVGNDYKVDDINKVCVPCEKKINEYLDERRFVNMEKLHTEVKNYIRCLRTENNAKNRNS